MIAVHSRPSAPQPHRSTETSHHKLLLFCVSHSMQAYPALSVSTLLHRPLRQCILPAGQHLNGRRKPQHLVQAYPTPDYYSGSSSSSNLGVLQQVIEQDSGSDDPYGMQRVSVDSFSSRGFYLEGGSIFSSLLLLTVLLALTFQRILGLDRFVDQAIRNWRDSRVLQRRSETLKAKEMLEQMWEKEEGQQ